jgi:hypothetical protein
MTDDPRIARLRDLEGQVDTFESNTDGVELIAALGIVADALDVPLIPAIDRMLRDHRPASEGEQVLHDLVFASQSNPTRALLDARWVTTLDEMIIALDEEIMND